MTNLVDRAMAVALQYHSGQVNKHNGEAYILHVQRVANHVRDRGLSDAHIAVAWLHDVVEDTDYSLAQLDLDFPAEVVVAVMAITKTKGQTNEDYYRLLALNSPIAAQVKISDIVDNFSRNHTIEDDATRLRMAAKYSRGLDILKEFV